MQQEALDFANGAPSFRGWCISIVITQIAKKYTVNAVGRPELRQLLRRSVMKFRVSAMFVSCCGLLCLAGGTTATSTQSATFYKDVLHILEQHCQVCHRAGEIAPIAFETYQQVKPRAAAIRDAVQSQSMPPWFADPCCGHFSNNPSLSPEELQKIVSWADAGAPAGDSKDAPSPPQWTQGWNIPAPGAVISMPKAVNIPADGDVQYTYEIVPTNFPEDR